VREGSSGSSSADARPSAAGRDALAAVRTVRGLRAAEVVKQDLVVEDGFMVAYRVWLAVAFDAAVGTPCVIAGGRTLS
jgi:flavin-binding protein dodecin